MNKLAFSLSLAILVSDLSQAKSAGSNSLQWQFGYDDRGRIIQRIDPAQRKTTYNYIEDDNKTLQRIIETGPNGKQTSRDFDTFGRLHQVVGKRQTTQYDYDGFSRLSTVRNADHPDIAYGYDTQDRITTVAVGEKVLSATTYDFLGRVETIKTPAGDFAYDYQTAQAKVIQRLPNGFYTIIVRSPEGRINSITHTNPKKVVLLRFRYHYRPGGLIDSIEEYAAKAGTRTLTFQYDNVQRVVAVNDSLMGKTAYQYDALGNRLIQTGTAGYARSSQYDWAGRLSELDGQSVDHDAAGNLTVLPTAQGKTVFEYAAHNALKAVKTQTSQVAYQYDANGLLIERTVNNHTTIFFPDPRAVNWQPLLVKHADGSKTMYLWAGNRLLASVSGKQVQYYLHDHLGSIRAVVDGRTNKVKTFDYDAFGQPQQVAQFSDLQPGFAGLFYDPHASLYLIQARGYSPALGRFLQIDPQHRVPFGSQKDLSSYVYCGNDPVNYVDLDGYAPQTFDSIYWQPIDVESRNISFPEMPTVNKVLTNAAHEMLIKAAISDAKTKLAKHWLGDHYDFVNGALSSVKDGKKAGKIFQKAVSASDYPDFYDLFLDITKWGAKGTLAGTVSSHLLTAKKLYTNLYDDVQSAFTQKQSENMVTLPLGVSRQIEPHVTGTAFRKNGNFTMSGKNNFAASGSWQLNDHLLNMHAKWKFNDTYLHNGAILSGKFEKWINQSSHKNAFAKRTVRKYQYRESFNGQEISRRLDDFNRTGVFQRPALEPTNVGGVYLQGAGKALAGFDDIQGISVDEKTGRLVLLSKSDKSIGLPPLRLDDVVTIFRCVYLHIAPFVSIDPVPEDPIGPAMNIRHSPCTDNTYVGWILFETDRLMKAYSLGEDNVSRLAIQSNISGYQNLVQLGFSNHIPGQFQPIWERFWIVPDQVRLSSSTDQRLSMFSVPLKVNTQRMEMQNGKLVPAKNPQPSQSADYFKNWFTRHYSEIAAENCPPNPNLSDQACVPVFNELRRMTLITAIAERMRDQHIPLPVWMLNYKVAPFPMPKTTPSIVVEDSQGRMTRSIYGGVDPSTFGREGEITTHDPAANQLADAVDTTIASLPLMTGMSISEGPTVHQAVALPGNKTQALGANRLEVIDLSVTVPTGERIALSRSSHSFFQPQGEFGRGWSINLPRLMTIQKPVQRTKDGVITQPIFQLTSPLNSVSDMFAKMAYVEEVNGELLVPEKSRDMLGLADGNNKVIGSKTRQLIFHDSRRWHFDENGYLVAEESMPMMIVYRRDAQHHIQRIEGWVGDTLRADITLHYQSDGKLKFAVTSNGEQVTYQYDNDGYLSRVEQGKTYTAYQYRKGLLNSVSQNGKVVRGFTYNDQGQLVSEKLADGSRRRYEQKAIAGGVEIIVQNTQSTHAKVSKGYDTAYRPLYIHYPEGSRNDWRYDADGHSEMTYTDQQGQRYATTTAENGQHQTLQLPEGGTVTEKYDAAGRLLSRVQDDQTVLNQRWQGGLLTAVESPTTGLYPQYDNQGLLDHILLAKPAKENKFSRWLDVKLNAAGNPEEIKDYTGNRVEIGYDSQGQITQVQSPQGTGSIVRDQDGRIKQVNTTWGMQMNSSYAGKTDKVERISLQQDGEQATIHFNQGKVENIRDFDGAKTHYRYYNHKKHAGQVQEIRLPNQLKLRYDYDVTHRLTSVVMSDRAGYRYRYNEQGQLIGLEWQAKH